MTNREFISEVANDLQALNVDEKVSKEYILNKGWKIASHFIKQESDNRRLFRMMELFTPVDNVALVPYGNYVRTRSPLAELYSTIYGVILRVFTIDGKKEFGFITPHEYQYTVNRTYRDKTKGYFWLQDGFLIIPDSFIDTIHISGMFLRPMEARKVSRNYTSPQPDEKGFCKGPLDDSFICPGYLQKLVRQETVKDLYSFLMKGMSVEDNRPDANIHSVK